MWSNRRGATAVFCTRCYAPFRVASCTAPLVQHVRRCHRLDLLRHGDVEPNPGPSMATPLGCGPPPPGNQPYAEPNPGPVRGTVFLACGPSTPREPSPGHASAPCGEDLPALWEDRLPDCLWNHNVDPDPDGGRGAPSRGLVTCDCDRSKVMTASRGLWPFQRHCRLCALRPPPVLLPEYGVALDPIACAGKTFSPGLTEIANPPPRAGGRGSLLTCGDVEENPGPRGPKGRGRGTSAPTCTRAPSDEDYAMRQDLVAHACAVLRAAPAASNVGLQGASSHLGATSTTSPPSRSTFVSTSPIRENGGFIHRVPRVDDAQEREKASSLAVQQTGNRALAAVANASTAVVHIVPMPDEAIHLASGTVLVPRPTWRTVVARITCGAAPTAASAHSEPSPPTSGTLPMDVDTPSHPEGPLMATRPPTSATVPDAAAGRFPALAPLVDQPMETGPLMRAADARASLRVSNQTVATPATTGLEAPPGDGGEGPRTVPGSWHCPFNTYCRSNESR